MVLILTVGGTLWAQKQKESPNYSELYTRLQRDYAKDEQDVSTLISLSDFYADTDNPMFSYPKAYRYIRQAEENYIAMVEDVARSREARKLIKKHVSVASLRQKKNAITASASRYVGNADEMTDSELDEFADEFANVAQVMNAVEQQRMKTRYNQAMQANTLEALSSFAKSYPGTAECERAENAMGTAAAKAVAAVEDEESVDAVLRPYMETPQVARAAARRKSAIAYARLTAAPTRAKCEEFIAKHRGSDEYVDALALLDKMLAAEFKDYSSPMQYTEFIKNYPENALVDEAMENLYSMIFDDRDPLAAEVYLENFPLDVKYNDVFLEYFNWHAEEGNLAPIQRFAQRYPQFPHKMALNDALKAAVEYDKIEVNKQFVEKEFGKWASKVYHLTGKKESFVGLQRTLQRFIAARDWKKALARINFFELSFEDYCVEEVDELRNILETPVRNELALTLLVAPAYNMTHPVMLPGNKRIYYNRTEKGVTSIYEAVYTEGRKAMWRGTGKVPFTDSENEGLQLFSLYDNGQRMLVGKDGDIWTAELKDSLWQLEERLPEPINSDAADYDAFMLADGSGILFASDRHGGRNLQPSHSYFHGDTAMASDIWFVPRVDGKWGGEAVNLGGNVNSPYMECSPVLSRDGKTLYFITDGRGGMGYGDVYYSHRNNVDDWQGWSIPHNMGKEVNSGYNEMAISEADEGNTLIINSNFKGNYGCYRLELARSKENSMRQLHVAAAEGTTIDITVTESMEPVCENVPVGDKGQWDTTVSMGQHYAVQGKDPGYFVPGVIFDPSSATETALKSYDADALAATQLALPALQFEENQSTLNGIAVKELNSLADFLESEPRLNVEIVVHVAGGDDAQCFVLSQERGMTIKNHLTSKGIDKDRIAVSAYGNSITKKGATTTMVALKASYEN